MGTLVTSPRRIFKIDKIVQKIQFDFYIYIAVDSSNIPEEYRRFQPM